MRHRGCSSALHGIGVKAGLKRMWASASPLTAACHTPRASRGYINLSALSQENRDVTRLHAKRSGEQDIDLSVFRFTLGIPGFDDSQLPRVLGFLFGGLIVLNHAFSSELVTGAQLRSEAAGMLASAFAISLPYLKDEMDGNPRKLASFPSDMKQVFSIAPWLTESQKQEVAWGSISLIRNTRTIGIIIWSGEEIILARGCWNVIEATEPLSNMQEMLAASPFRSSTTTMYMSNAADGQGIKLVPKGAKSLLAQPFISKKGGIIVISDLPRAYRAKDRTWIELIANKMSPLL